MFCVGGVCEAAPRGNQRGEVILGGSWSFTAGWELEFEESGRLCSPANYIVSARQRYSEWDLGGIQP